MTTRSSFALSRYATTARFGLRLRCLAGSETSYQLSSHSLEGRQRVGLTPDLLLRFPTPDGVSDCLGELKAMSAGVTRYPPGKNEKQADRRARELPATYRSPLERLDRQYLGTAPGDTGPLVARLQSYGDLQCLHHA